MSKVNSNGDEVRNAVNFLEGRKRYLNKEFKMNCGSIIRVDDYIDKFNVNISFQDGTNYSCVANIDNIKNGSVKNPFLPNVYGGYFGIGPYKAINNMRIYKVWSGMLKRANVYMDRVAYYNCTVDPEWLNFQIFCEWYLEKQSRLNPDYWNELQLDKDVLQWNLPNKIYSKNTCCLIPKELNSILVSLSGPSEGSLPRGVQRNSGKFSPYINEGPKRKYYGIYENPEEAFGVYKIYKLNRIKDVADKYLSVNAIEKDIYTTLINIEILP